ncbi:MAG: hypothetical protein IJW82_00820 [Clostridia bacterium]|nr:hypothetical protein [Clostridia bacterium]
MLTQAKDGLTTAYNNVIAKIEEASVKVSEHLDEISTKQTQAITTFTTEFETTYETNKQNSKNKWKEMRDSMVQGYQSEVE